MIGVSLVPGLHPRCRKFSVETGHQLGEARCFTQHDDEALVDCNLQALNFAPSGVFACAARVVESAAPRCANL